MTTLKKRAVWSECKSDDSVVIDLLLYIPPIVFWGSVLIFGLFICTLWSPAGKELTSWLSFVVSNCEFVTFPLVSWVRCSA